MPLATHALLTLNACLKSKEFIFQTGIYAATNSMPNIMSTPPSFQTASRSLHQMPMDMEVVVLGIQLAWNRRILLICLKSLSLRGMEQELHTINKQIQSINSLATQMVIFIIGRGPLIEIELIN